MAVIAVTGASGFIGMCLAKALCRDGHRVRILLRKRAQHQSFIDTNTDIIEGDLSNIDALARLVKDADAVIHCAGNVRGRVPEDFAINADGVTNLTSAIKQHSASARLLLLSSLAAKEPQLSYYAASKCNGEAVLLDHCDDINWTIFRPAAVYGPGDQELLPVFRLMTKGFALLPGAADSRVALVHIDDLVSASMLWLNSSNVRHQVFDIDDGVTAGYSWQEIASIVGEQFDRQVRLISIPTTLLDLVAGTNRLCAALFGYQPMLTPEKLRELRHPDWSSDSSQFQTASGWHPTVPFSRGICTIPNLRR